LFFSTYYRHTQSIINGAIISFGEGFSDTLVDGNLAQFTHCRDSRLRGNDGVGWNVGVGWNDGVGWNVGEDWNDLLISIVWQMCACHHFITTD
jgi:hypothetical protein